MTQIRQMTTDFCWANAMNSTQMPQTEAQMTADFLWLARWKGTQMSQTEAQMTADFFVAGAVEGHTDDTDPTDDHGFLLG